MKRPQSISTSVSRIIIGVGLVASGALACSSSSGGGGSGTSGGTSGSASGLTGTCAALESCCATVIEKDKVGCNFAATNSQNNPGACTDALKKYPTCGGGGGTGDSGTPVGGCGDPGATPVASPADCATPAGACIFHEHDTPERGAQQVCLEFGGQWAASPSSAETQCHGSGPAGKHEWALGKHCGEVVTGIQGGCQTHSKSVALCTTTYYGPGCATALGSSCNGQTSVVSLWVSP